MVKATLGEIARVVSWGSDHPFTQAGTDFDYKAFRIECWLRSINQIDADLVACQRGEIRRDYSVWAVMGFFRHVVLADVQSMHILDDPDGILARWKGQVSTYPEPLRHAIVQRFMVEAAFWPENPHYESAIERGDVIYASAIVQQVIQGIIQVVFALNRVYFPGEKKLAEVSRTLPHTPVEFTKRIQFLSTLTSGPIRARLAEQRKELAALVAEVQDLVAIR